MNLLYTVKTKTSKINPISANIPQGTILASSFYNIFTSDFLHSNSTFFATFKDTTAILAFSPGAINTSKSHHDNFIKRQKWFKL